ncbi:RNA pyrophosphohydrolase [compost metagenome]
MAKPNYKKSWQLPGGGVDNGESPEEAAVREVREELNLDIFENDLNIKGTIYKQDEELLFVVYEYGKLISEEVELKLQADEIIDFQFVATADVAPLLSDYYTDFWNRYYL